MTSERKHAAARVKVERYYVPQSQDLLIPGYRVFQSSSGGPSHLDLRSDGGINLAPGPLWTIWKDEESEGVKECPGNSKCDAPHLWKWANFPERWRCIGRTPM